MTWSITLAWVVIYTDGEGEGGCCSEHANDVFDLLGQ